MRGIDEPIEVHEIIERLRANIKPVASKLIEIDLFNLRVPENNYTEFAKNVIKLTGRLKHSVIYEGVPIATANKYEVEKTIKMCNNSTKNRLIYVLLSSRSFDSPREVILEVCTELQRIEEEKKNKY